MSGTLTSRTIAVRVVTTFFRDLIRPQLGIKAGRSVKGGLYLYAGVDMTGLWIGLVVDEGQRGTINYMRWNSNIWQGKSVIA